MFPTIKGTKLENIICPYKFWLLPASAFLLQTVIYKHVISAANQKRPQEWGDFKVALGQPTAVLEGKTGYCFTIITNINL